jgi:hypothetical protein
MCESLQGITGTFMRVYCFAGDAFVAVNSVPSFYLAWVKVTAKGVDIQARKVLECSPTGNTNPRSVIMHAVHMLSKEGVILELFPADWSYGQASIYRYWVINGFVVSLFTTPQMDSTIFPFSNLHMAWKMLTRVIFGRWDFISYRADIALNCYSSWKSNSLEFRFVFELNMRIQEVVKFGISSATKWSDSRLVRFRNN